MLCSKHHFNPASFRNTLMIFACLSLLPMFSACSSQRGTPGCVPAAGIVTLNGVPVEGAGISFAPQPGNPNAQSAFATTDQSGAFVVTTTKQGDGMQSGEYIVMVKKTTVTGEKSSTGGGDDRQVVNHLPPKYAHKDTSGLTVTIPPNGNRNIELKLEGEVDLTPQRRISR